MSITSVLRAMTRFLSFRRNVNVVTEVEQVDPEPSHIILEDEFESLEGKFSDNMEMKEIEKLQERINRLLSAPANPAKEPSGRAAVFFCTYDAQHMQRANDWASAFWCEADELPGLEGLAAAISAMEMVLPNEPVRGLIQYAIKLFLVRNEKAKKYLYLEPIEARQPWAVSPRGRGPGPIPNG